MWCILSVCLSVCDYVILVQTCVQLYGLLFVSGVVLVCVILLLCLSTCHRIMFELSLSTAATVVVLIIVITVIIVLFCKPIFQLFL